MPPLTVIGTGYVGLVTACGLAKLGHRVVAMDKDEKKIQLLKQMKSPLREEGLDDLLAETVAAGTIEFTDDLARAVTSSRLLLIAVNTPVGEDSSADLSQILEVAQGLAQFIKEYKIIVIKSTAPIGTCEMIQEVFKESKLIEGTDYRIAVNPEFLREGNAVYDFFNPARIIVGASDKEVGEEVLALYRGISAPRLLTSIADAQIIKYAANAFLAARVSFINEIANICEAVGGDITEVAKGIALDTRIGDGYLEAGIGFGGGCLPKDILALIRMAEENGYSPRLLDAIYQKNEHQLRTIVHKVKGALAGTVANKTIAVLGLTFKAGTDDVRNSLAIKIIQLLLKEGAAVNAYDPIGDSPRGSAEKIESAVNLNKIAIKADGPSACRNADAILILTGWHQFRALDWAAVKRTVHNPIIIDGVNLLDPEEMRSLGFTYIGVGRASGGC
jgi:UDPglucose 6-dehydrogenase